MVDVRGKGRKRGIGVFCVRMVLKEKIVFLGRFWRKGVVWGNEWW